MYHNKEAHYLAKIPSANKVRRLSGMGKRRGMHIKLCTCTHFYVHFERPVPVRRSSNKSILLISGQDLKFPDRISCEQEAGNNKM
jgi:hypothetical protein